MRLELWDERGLALERRANTPEMKEHLGGPESDERLVDRHRRISGGQLGGAHFLVIVPEAPDPVGSVGFWARVWRDEPVWEMGWKILPGFQGRGLAAAACRAVLARVAEREERRWVHAYPNITNAASNALCRRVGFELLGEVDFEFPPGNPLRCHDWRYDPFPAA